MACTEVKAKFLIILSNHSKTRILEIQLEFSLTVVVAVAVALKYIRKTKVTWTND